MHFSCIPYHCLLCGCDNHMWALPHVATLLNLTPIFEWYMTRVIFKNKFKRNFRFNSQHNWDGLCDHLKTKRNLTFNYFDLLIFVSN